MPYVLAIGALIVGGISAAVGLTKVADEAQDSASRAFVNLGGLLMLAFGSYMLYKAVK